MYNPVSEPFGTHIIVMVRSQQVLPYTQDFWIVCLSYKGLEQLYLLKTTPLHGRSQAMRWYHVPYQPGNRGEIPYINSATGEYFSISSRGVLKFRWVLSLHREVFPERQIFRFFPLVFPEGLIVHEDVNAILINS